MGIAGWKSLLEQIIHCKNYQQMTQIPTIQNTQCSWTHLLRLQCIYKELPINKVTNTLMSECYCDFDQYTACDTDGTHQTSTYSPLPSWHLPHNGTKGKDTVVECLWPRGDNLLHISIYCNHLPARWISRIQWQIKHWAQDWDWSKTYSQNSCPVGCMTSGIFMQKDNAMAK